MGADIVGRYCTTKDNEAHGLPRMAVMPASKAKIEMTWDTVGLKGTGSHDLVVENVYWYPRNGPLFVVSLQNYPSHF